MTHPRQDEADPFGLEVRNRHLALAERDLDLRASGLVANTVADQARRGIAFVGFHPVCDTIIQMSAELIDRALAFDGQARVYELKRAEIRGDCSNPFSEARAKELYDVMARRVDRMPAWVRSLPGGKQLWWQLDEQHATDLCDTTKSTLAVRIDLEYGKRRAEFELDREQAREAARLVASGMAPPGPAGGTPSKKKNELQEFCGGTMVFFHDRVEFCGVVICRGARSKTKRICLDLLRLKRADGSYVPYSGADLGSTAGIEGGEKAVAGVIRDLRDRMVEVLRETTELEFDGNKIILSRGPGYRLAECVSVQDGEHLAKAPIGDTEPVSGVPDVPDGDKVSVPNDGAPAGRRAWILQRLAQRHPLRAGDVATRFSCSRKTALRDLGQLKKNGQIEFFGSRRTGYYRLTRGPGTD